MEEITCDKTYQEHTLIKALEITALAILILVDITCAAPFAYVTNMGDYHNDTNYNPNVAVYNPCVAVINTATNNITARVPLGGGWPVGIAVNPAETKVYVVDSPMDISTVYM
jgi:YVTN family beta-propeller protein